MITSDYKLYYELQHEATNNPVTYVAKYKQKSRALALPDYVYTFFYAKASLIMGDTQISLDTFRQVERSILKSSNSIMMGLFYLVSYYTYKYIGADQEQCKKYYDLALTACKNSDSSALKCEAKLLDIRKNHSSRTLDENEDLLKEAIRYAMEADIMDLNLEVHLEYIALYLNNARSEMASRDLILLQDALNSERNPYHYVQMQNYLGILHLMMREFDKSSEVLRLALDLANQKQYRNLSIYVLMNLGITRVRNQNLAEGISLYYESMELISKCGLENSENAEKTKDNLALALAFSNKLEESIQLMRSEFEKCKASANDSRLNKLKVNLADVLIEVENFPEASELLKEAIEYYQKNGNQDHLISAYRCNARLYEAQEDFPTAFHAMEILDQANRKHFQTTFYSQSSMFQNRIESLRNEYIMLKSQCSDVDSSHHYHLSSGLIGEHPQIKKALSEARMAARYPFINVLITGESGTGKEVIARIIHNESKTGKQMVAINTSAISPNLIESELFGHKKGAFTGAINDKKGKFLLADKGTLLMDEISEMPIELQAKLLRAIETHTIQPVGSDLDIKVNCRIISTSNCNIKDLILNNKFRLDLYHRLNKLEIHLIPLRERLSDLELLANYFIRHSAREFGFPEPSVTDEFYTRLKQYTFPGNVRELMNIVERIFILRPNPIWDAHQLDGLIDINKSRDYSPNNISQNLKKTEYHIILETLQNCNWIQKEAAKLLGMTESTLCRRIKALGIKN